MWLPQPGCRGLVVNARCLAGYPVDKRFLDRDDLLPAFAAELQVLGENKGMVCGTRQNAVKTFLYRLHELGKLDTDLHRVFERVDSGVFEDVAVGAELHANVDARGSGTSARVDVQVVPHLSRRRSSTRRTASQHLPSFS